MARSPIYYERKSKGLCPSCGELPDRGIHCKACRDRGSSRSLKAYYKDVEAARERRRKYARSLHREALEAYGGVCVCCGEAEQAYLQLDHIGGGGGKHRREMNSGTGFWVQMRREGWPPILQVLCANCHFAKSFRDGCPCQPRG